MHPTLNTTLGDLLSFLHAVANMVNLALQSVPLRSSCSFKALHFESTGGCGLSNRPKISILL